MSTLLISEAPLQLLPSLAVAVGVNEALFLQQLHYWIQRSTNIRNNMKWVYNTHKDWSEQFPFWNVSTLRRVISGLVDKKLVITANHNKSIMDKTKWYTINYERLKQLESRFVKSDSPCVQNEQIEVLNLNTSTAQNEHIYIKQENTQEITQENTDSGSAKASPSLFSDTKSLLIKKEKESLRKRKIITVTYAEKFWKAILSEYIKRPKHLNFTQREKGNMGTLIKQLKGQVEVLDFLEFAVKNWGGLGEELKWDNGKKSRLSPSPMFVELFLNRDDILRLMQDGFDNKEQKTKSVVTYTRVEDIPMDLPQRVNLIKLIKKFGKAEVQL